MVWRCSVMCLLFSDVIFGLWLVAFGVAVVAVAMTVLMVVVWRCSVMCLFFSDVIFGLWLVGVLVCIGFHTIGWLMFGSPHVDRLTVVLAVCKCWLVSVVAAAVVFVCCRRMRVCGICRAHTQWSPCAAHHGTLLLPSVSPLLPWR